MWLFPVPALLTRVAAVAELCFRQPSLVHHSALSRALLDTVYPDKPLIVWHRSFHELFANSEALKQTEFEVY